MFYDKFKDICKGNKIIKEAMEINKYYIDTVLINKIILRKEGIREENIIDAKKKKPEEMLV